MATCIESDRAVESEAVEVLLRHMPASKVAQLLAAWKVGEGDYLRLRDHLFAGETVNSLCEDVLRTEWGDCDTAGPRLNPTFARRSEPITSP